MTDDIDPKAPECKRCGDDIPSDAMKASDDLWAHIHSRQRGVDKPYPWSKWAKQEIARALSGFRDDGFREAAERAGLRGGTAGGVLAGAMMMIEDQSIRIEEFEQMERLAGAKLFEVCAEAEEKARRIVELERVLREVRGVLTENHGVARARGYPALKEWAQAVATVEAALGEDWL